MDPNTCLAQIERSLKYSRTVDSRDALVDLITWLKRGGFAPTKNLRQEAIIMATMIGLGTLAQVCFDLIAEAHKAQVAS